MKQLSIIISDQEADIYNQSLLKLALNYSIADITDISTRSASISKTITLPGTKKNDILFGYGADINSDTAISQNIKPDARIEIDGTPLMIGFAKISLIKIDDKTHEYQLIIIGDNGDWKGKIEDLNLTDLDYSEFDHAWNHDNVLLSEKIDSSGGPLTKPDLVYPVINYGKILNDLSTVFGTGMRFPAMQIRSLFLQILNSLGYNVISNFLNTDFFRRLYMPFCNENLIMPESFRQELLFRASPLTDQIFSTDITLDYGQNTTKFPIFNNTTTGGNFDNGNHFSPSTSIYPPPCPVYHIEKYCQQKFTLGIHLWIDFYLLTYPPLDSINLQISVNILRRFYPYYATILKNETIDIIINVPNNYGQTFYVDHIFKIETDWILLTPDDEIYSYITITNNGDKIRMDNIKFKIDSYFYNDVSLTARLNNTINISPNLPDLKQIDFLKAMIEQFNLMLITNVEERKIYIEPFNEFYKAQAIIWEDNNIHKLDESKAQEITDLNQNYNKIFKYIHKKDSNDKIVEEIEKQNEIDLASFEIENDNKFVEGETKIGDKLFAPTFMDTWNSMGFTQSKIPRMNAECVELPAQALLKTKFELRLLYYAGITAMQTGGHWHDNELLPNIERNDYPYLYSVDDNTENNNSLYWCDTLKSNGLFKKFHKAKFDILNEGKLYSAYFHLTDKDISNLDFRIPIFIKDCYYLLNKVVNYDPLSNSSTKVDLIKAVNINTIAILEKKDVVLFPVINPPTIAIPIPPPAYPIQVPINGFVRQPPSEAQVVFGITTEGGNEAHLIINQKSPSGIVKSLMTIDNNGTMKAGNGSEMKISLNNISYPMVYTDENGEEQNMVISEL